VSGIALTLDAATASAEELGSLAASCLHLEIDTYPKPGLVSQVDTGSHADMTAAMLHASADLLQPYFAELATAGAQGAEMGRLRVIGIEAERAMLAATGGVNTYRGAIFGLGLLVAAAGFRSVWRGDRTLGGIVSRLWGDAILAGPVALRSHGSDAARRYGAGGARRQAADGFPTLYETGLLALASGACLSNGNEEAARVQCCFALIATLDDTNLLHRGGPEGLDFARRSAAEFIARGGVGRLDWRSEARAVHEAFVARNLSPGGSADLLAMSLFARALGETC
jgi:triphosphoribosyl-dephospho-CoA synthase